MATMRPSSLAVRQERRPHRCTLRQKAPSPSPSRLSGTRLSRAEASQQLLAARSSECPSREQKSVARSHCADGTNGIRTAAAAVFEEYAETIYPNMIDRERAAAIYMHQHRLVTGSVAERERDKRRREATDVLRRQGVVMSLARCSKTWRLPPSGAPGWLEPLAAAQLRLVFALLLKGHAPPNLFCRPLLNDTDIAESIGLLLSSQSELVFMEARHNILLTNGGTVASGGPYAWGSALSASVDPSVHELHFAEFHLCTHSSSNECIVGVASANYDPCGAEPFATTGTQGWGFNAWSGKHAYAGRESLPIWCTKADVSVPVAIGQTIGLLLDLRGQNGCGTLTVWIDGQRQGLLCSGIPIPAEPAVGLRWLVELKSAGCHVKLRARPPPAEV